MQDHPQPLLANDAITSAAVLHSHHMYPSPVIVLASSDPHTATKALAAATGWPIARPDREPTNRETRWALTFTPDGSAITGIGTSHWPPDPADPSAPLWVPAAPIDPGPATWMYAQAEAFAYVYGVVDTADLDQYRNHRLFYRPDVPGVLRIAGQIPMQTTTGPIVSRSYES